MDQESQKGKQVVEENQGESKNSIYPYRNSSDSNDGVVLNLAETVSINEEDGVLNANSDSSRANDRPVNQDKSDGHQRLESFDDGASSSDMVNRIVPGGSSGAARFNGGNKDERTTNGLKLNISSQEIQGERRDSDALIHVVQGRNVASGNSAAGIVLETVIVISSDETAGFSGKNQDSQVRGDDLEMNTITVDKSKRKLAKGQKPSYVVDAKRDCENGGGSSKDNCDGESVCRICHLSSEALIGSPVSVTAGVTISSLDLIQLGCGCKDELGIAHPHCAEAWFKLKGNRMCEICGETAKNVSAVRDSRFMEEWNQRRFIGGSNSISDHSAACWRGQPFCNFLMACLVIAFVLPWFFRVNMF